MQTCDYWHGYAGTMVVSAPDAARWLSWVETGNDGAALIRPYGVKAISYSNPNRVQPGDPLYSDDDSEFAHTCDGSRARGESSYHGQYLLNPASPALANLWLSKLHANSNILLYSALFVDEAVGAKYAADVPCGYNTAEWLRAETQLFRTIHYPIIYNGLNDFADHGVAPEIALNKAAIGGLMEECYAQLNPDHRINGWVWLATEQTEIRMAKDHKYFVCYGRDLTPAEQAYDSRMYTYSSFLLTYDPNTTVLWEYYKTPTGAHVMPETQLVALDPVKRSVNNIEQLRSPQGVYIRAYRHCYIAGKSQGPCAAVVNPDDAAHSVSLPGYRRTLVLQGSGVFDGGTVRVQNAPPPGSLDPRGAFIAFR